MEKKPCYIFWDDNSVNENERSIYLQCEDCYKKNKKGKRWPDHALCGDGELKCNLCNTIIYKYEKNKDQTSI